jgi:replicative DNA helicase
MSKNRAALDRVPPQNIDAERAVLGGMMLAAESKEATARLINTGINREDFYREAHSKVYDAIVDLFNTDQEIDLLTVTARLENLGALEQIGGVGYLDELIDSTPTAANIEHHAKLVKEESLRRQVILATAEANMRGYDGTENIQELLAELQNRLLALTTSFVDNKPTLLRHLLKDQINNISEMSKRGESITGLRTGFFDLDKYTAGIQRGDYVIAAGRPGMGKSTLVQNITQRVAEEGETVLIFSLEMSKGNWLMRMLSSETGIDYQRLRTGFLKEVEWSRLTLALGKISEMKVLIDDQVDLTPLTMRAKCNAVAVEHGLGLIIVDHVQLMDSDRPAENRNQEMTAVSKGLKAIARQFNAPLIAVSQLNRSVDSRAKDEKRPRLSDLRETGSFEQDADLVMFLYRDDYYDKNENPGEAELIIGKQRNGTTGTVKLVFDKALCSFRDAYKNGKDDENHGDSN